VNWFRRGDDGRFLWPGFGQNVRVLTWMIDRVKGRTGARETPIGLVPDPAALNLEGLGLGGADVERLLRVDRDEWAAEVPEIRSFFRRFDDRLPPELGRALDTLSHHVTAAAV
jgi:phosphoenolpyruvate carboxykinase (GTP)